MKRFTQRLALTSLVSLSTLFAATTWAKDDHHPKFGGQVRETASYDLEMVAKDKELVVYVNDHKGNRVDTKAITSRAVVMTGKDRETIKLTASGDGVLKGTTAAPVAADTKVILSIIVGEKTEQARFAPLQKEKTDNHKGHKH